MGREGDIVGGVFQKDRGLSMVWFGGHTHCRAPVRNCQSFHLPQCSGCQPLCYLWLRDIFGNQLGEKKSLWSVDMLEAGESLKVTGRTSGMSDWGILENGNIQICGICLREDKISAE